uniref:Uncharacterized protein n=1 Tax=Panagrolaimus sp. PS1159 TaxID=55785 RepID=A0AC35GJW6_9BILA
MEPESAVIKKCEAPFLPIKYEFNLTEAQMNFPIHYIFLLNTNLDNSMQKQILTIYHSITCMIPSTSSSNSNNSTKFHLITLGENNQRIHFGNNPEKWLYTFQNNNFSGTFENQKVLNICEQLIQGLQKFVFEEKNREALSNGLKNFVMFQMIDNFGPEKCQKDLFGFLKKNNLTNTIGISQNVITFGPASPHLPPPMINENLSKNPQFFTGAFISFKNFYGFNSSNNILYASIKPFVDEMISISENFVKYYTTFAKASDENENVIEMVETLLDGFPSNKTTVQKSPPHIKNVTIFALFLALLLLACVIIVSTYDHSFFTDHSFIRERAQRFRQNRGRRNTETVSLIEVPMENLSETIFGESPSLQQFSDGPLLDLTPASTKTSEESNNNQIHRPNLIIQIEDDNFAEVKLTE